MSFNINNTFPHIIWIAARPPLLPFSGEILKTICGLKSLCKHTHIDLVTFADSMDENRIYESFQDFCLDKSIKIHLIEPHKKFSWMKSIIHKQFISSQLVNEAKLEELLNNLGWFNKNRILIFDDIILTPFAQKYGQNTIFSPHDCLSEMFRSHYKLMPFGLPKLYKMIQHLIALCMEKKYYHKFLLVHVITQRDRFLLERINRKARYHVIPNENSIDSNFYKNGINHWDILLWGNIDIPSVASGVIDFLKKFSRDPEWVKNTRLAIIGRVAENKAEKIIGYKLYSICDYYSRIEDENGRARVAKITIIPDIGGAGIKNRAINILASGQCLACLYPQMEGLEQACDIGAINAFNMAELYNKVKFVLDQGSYNTIGVIGQQIYNNYNKAGQFDNLWAELILRAIALRELNKGISKC